MKKLRSLMILSFILCCLSFFTACNNDKLATPTKLEIDTETLELTWDGDVNADGYVVKIDGKEYISRRTSFAKLDELSEGTYTIYVKATGDQVSYKDSNWSAGKVFIKAKEAPVEYQLTLDKKAYEVAGKGTAYGKVEIDAEYRGKPVVGIADAAFANIRGITEVVLPETITYIGKRAFYSCMDMKSINLPENLNSLGERAFQGCGELLSITIPKNITALEQYMFTYCRKMESVTFKSQIEVIGARAFSDCNALKEIRLPNSVTTISEYAFSNCSEATVIDIGTSVKTIGDYAFYGCKKVASLDLGKNITSIGKYCFATCLELVSLELPEGITVIPEYAFYQCANLASITFSENVKEIQKYAFYNTAIWNDSTDIVYTNNWIVGVKEEAREKPRFSIEKGTVGLGADAFVGCNNLSAISIPNSVKYIGDRAFKQCKLQGVEIGDEDQPESELLIIGKEAFCNDNELSTIKIHGNKLETIDDYAFYGCEMLAYLDLPDSVTRIGVYAFNKTRIWTNSNSVVYVDQWVVGFKQGEYVAVINNGVVGISDYAFYDCATLQSVALPYTLKYIGIAAFYQCLLLESIEIPSGVEEIPDYTFIKCAMLRSVKLPNTIKRIGRSAFYSCVSLKEVIVPGSVENIGDYAFYGCLTLSNVVVSEGVETIGKRVFQGCVQLVSVSLPDSLTELGSHAFYNCQELTSVKLGNGLERIETYSFFNCAKLTQIAIPDSVTYIGKSAFRKCSTMTVIVLGENLKEIDDFAFYGCAFKTFKIPNSVSRIGNYALRNNELLKSLIISTNVEDLGKHVIYGCKNLTIYVEDGVDMTNWAGTWNSYFRPVVWDVTLSEDNSYVVSFVMPNELENREALNGMQQPSRLGYTFSGWSLTENGSLDYTFSNMNEAPEGVVLYAIWSEDN